MAIGIGAEDEPWDSAFVRSQARQKGHDIAGRSRFEGLPFATLVEEAASADYRNHPAGGSVRDAEVVRRQIDGIARV